MVSHNSHRLSSPLCIPFFSAFLWINFKVPVFKLTDFFFFFYLIDSAFYSLLHFSFHLLYSSASEFLLGSFLNYFCHFLKLIILLIIVLLILLNCLFVLFCSSLSFLNTAILNSLSDKLQLSRPSESVTRRLLWSSGGSIFPWFFMFFEVLHCCPLVFNDCLLQCVQT